jgi:protein TonB
MISKPKSGKIIDVKILMGLLLVTSLFTVFSCNQKKIVKSTGSQVNSEQIEEKVYIEVEQMPEFPGGQAELIKFIGNSVKYPVKAMKANIQGKVFVSFVIGKDGSVKDVKIARGVDPLLDAEGIRVVKSMPKWTPGKNKEVEVAVQYTIPINFALR